MSPGLDKAPASGPQSPATATSARAFERGREGQRCPLQGRGELPAFRPPRSPAARSSPTGIGGIEGRSPVPPRSALCPSGSRRESRDWRRSRRVAPVGRMGPLQVPWRLVHGPAVPVRSCSGAMRGPSQGVRTDSRSERGLGAARSQGTPRSPPGSGRLVRQYRAQEGHPAAKFPPGRARETVPGGTGPGRPFDQPAQAPSVGTRNRARVNFLV
jgi:hypothetical protein